MMLKEDFRPNSYDRFAYALAPWVVFTPVLLVFAVIPFGGMLVPSTLLQGLPSGRDLVRRSRVPDADRARRRRAARSSSRSVGLTIIGTMLAGWSSSNKFSLLGALRAGSQMISYELIMGLTVLGFDPHLRLGRPERDRARSVGDALGVLPAWGVFVQPFAAILFLTAAIAENKRIPVRPARGGIGADRRLLHRIQRDEDGPVHVREFIEIAIIGALFHDALPRRLQPPVHDRRGIRAAGRSRSPGLRTERSSSSSSSCSWSR
jgi:NADH-quinone oxidoreductase subunit H